MKKNTRRRSTLTIRHETLRSLSLGERALVSGASVSTCPPTIGNACATLRTCVGHATCYC